MLTKPLGTGIITTALRIGKLRQTQLAAAGAQHHQSQRGVHGGQRQQPGTGRRAGRCADQMADRVAEAAQRFVAVVEGGVGDRRTLL